MRASRLLAMLLHLQATGGCTARELADHLEVSERTVYRDVASLQEAGVPVWTETGPGGGIRLVDGWRGRLGGLTADEAGALLLAGSGAAAELGLGSVLAVAESKVMAALPPELRGRAARVRERFHLDAPGWFGGDGGPPACLPVVAAAVWEGTRLDVRYGARPPGAARRLDPLGLVLKAGTWYLVAAHRGEARTYRLARVLEATPLDERVRRPDGFDLPAWWAASAAEFDRALLRAEVRVRLDRTGRRRLHEAVGPLAARLARPADGTEEGPDGDGWVDVTLPVESVEVAAHQLLALGPHVEAVAPPDLRARLLAAAEAMVARHRGPVPPPPAGDADRPHPSNTG